MSGRERPKPLDKVDNPVKPPTRPDPEAGETIVVEDAPKDGQHRLGAVVAAGQNQLDSFAPDLTDGDDPAAQQMMAGLVGLRRRKVDPMKDYVADGTRRLRWVQAAVAHQAALTGESQQDILRDAELGIRPIWPHLLDAYYEEFYGEPRRG